MHAEELDRWIMLTTICLYIQIATTLLWSSQFLAFRSSHRSMVINTVGVVIFWRLLKGWLHSTEVAKKEFVTKSPQPKLWVKADVAQAPVIQQPLTCVVPCMHHDDMYSNPPLFNQLIASYIFCIISLSLSYYLWPPDSQITFVEFN